MDAHTGMNANLSFVSQAQAAQAAQTPSEAAKTTSNGRVFTPISSEDLQIFDTARSSGPPRLPEKLVHTTQTTNATSVLTLFSSSQPTKFSPKAPSTSPTSERHISSSTHSSQAATASRVNDTSSYHIPAAVVTTPASSQSPAETMPDIMAMMVANGGHAVVDAAPSSLAHLPDTPVEMKRAPPTKGEVDRELSAMKSLIDSLASDKKVIKTSSGQIIATTWKKSFLGGKEAPSPEAMKGLLEGIDRLSQNGKSTESTLLLKNLMASEWGKAVLAKNPQVRNQVPLLLSQIFISSPEAHKECNNAFLQLDKNNPCLILNEKMQLEAVSRTDKRATPDNIKNGVELLAHLARHQAAQGKSTMNTKEEPQTFLDTIGRLERYETIPAPSRNIVGEAKTTCREQVRQDMHSMTVKYQTLSANAQKITNNFTEHPGLLTALDIDPKATVDSLTTRIAAATQKQTVLEEKVKIKGYEITNDDNLTLSRANPVTISENLNTQIIGKIYDMAKEKLSGDEKALLGGLKAKVMQSIDPENPVPISDAELSQFMNICEEALKRP